MTVFGDYDPDDAWDASDPVPEQLRILAQRIEWLIDHRDDLSARVARIVADVALIRRRIINGDL
jgi:hypothetical protein